MIEAPKVRKSNIQLSDDFFKIVFNDEFIFSAYRGPTAKQILDESSLSEDEKKFALRVYRSKLYTQDTQQQCIDLCDQLVDVFHWQSNTEGACIFASKIWYLLLAQEQDVDWFKQRMLERFL
jgi:ubiquitin C-terminal hydrolase